ncbi:hypothetical protein [Fulvivirga ligni]|uniref:hypothetical protein n=1 Tax=Fulvivirga ligni TaxID=2904246 RepID=UPI001F271EDC|nr:hypothetical protein [Fulvivirga ligni]UII21706.1 hypothetical protein LVD16_00445 [Fulvivirga ligni]
MKVYRLLFVLFVLMLSLNACDDEETPDARLALTGTYDMEDAEVRFTRTNPIMDTTVYLDFNSEIEFEIDDELDSDELQVDLNDFIEKLLKEVLRIFNDQVLVEVDIDGDDTVAKGEDGKYSIEEFEFDMPFSIIGGSESTVVVKIDIDGEMDGDEHEIEFDIAAGAFTANDSPIRLRGTAMGKRH